MLTAKILIDGEEVDEIIIHDTGDVAAIKDTKVHVCKIIHPDGLLNPTIFHVREKGWLFLMRLALERIWFERIQSEKRQQLIDAARKGGDTHAYDRRNGED